jgi:copper homeostasis protein
VNNQSSSIIEVCVDTVESAIAAQRGGADRVELCASLLEGGVTPSAGAIQLARKSLGVPIQVMIRPRGGDFLYSNVDFEIMKRDVEVTKRLGAGGVVFGILTLDGEIDKERTGELKERTRPLAVTFHRAFDMTRDPYQAMEDLIELGVDRVLTSGQAASAAEGAKLIRTLVETARGRIAIMAGGGLNETNIRYVVASTGVRELHFSGRTTSDSRMRYRNLNLSLGCAQQHSEYQLMVADAERIGRIREAANSGLDAPDPAPGIADSQQLL